MSNVLVEKNKLDVLATAISNKSGEPLKLTLDEMVEAVDGIEPYVEPNLQAKSHTVSSAGTETIEADSGYDGLSEVEVSVPTGSIDIFTTGNFQTINGTKYFIFYADAGIESNNDMGTEGYIPDHTTVSQHSDYLAVPAGTSVTPTESAQTIGGIRRMMEGAVTVSAIPSNYVGSGITQRSSSDLTVSGATVTAPSGYYSASASKSVASGTAGTPTATKGTVSNHSVSVTPSVTNTTGFITGSTKSGTAVTVSASELVSGSETKTENGTYDVTNLAEIVIDVQGGGSSTISVGKTTRTLASASSSIQFTGLSGNPTSFAVTSSADITTNTNGVTAVVFDGTSLHGQILSTQATADTGFTKSYSGGTLTITATTGTFQANEYKLVYTYGGSTSDIETEDIQVGSGATSITFPVTGRPIYWSCIFKSDFGTSSGYQRVIEVVNDGSSTYGMCLDSSAHASSSYWTASYSGGSLTISSQGTNAGGYFHQPGYYQLTYIVDESAPSYQTKTVTPTTSQQVVTADTGYDALSQVTVNAMPSMTLPSSTSATSSGTSKATISASSSTQYLNIPTGYNATAQYYTISASGGGGSSTCDTKTVTNSNDQATSIEFTGLSGQPKWFFVRCTSQLTRSSSYSYYYITAVRYNGTNHYGNYYRRSNGTFYNDTTHYSHTYSNGTLTVSSSAGRGSAGGSFYNGGYELVYIY